VACANPCGAGRGLKYCGHDKAVLVYAACAALKVGAPGGCKECRKIGRACVTLRERAAGAVTPEMLTGAGKSLPARKGDRDFHEILAEPLAYCIRKLL